MARSMERYLTLKVQKVRTKELDQMLRSLLIPEPEEHHEFLEVPVTDM